MADRPVATRPALWKNAIAYSLLIIAMVFTIASISLDYKAPVTLLADFILCSVIAFPGAWHFYHSAKDKQAIEEYEVKQRADLQLYASIAAENPYFAQSIEPTPPPLRSVRQWKYVAPALIAATFIAAVMLPPV